MGDFLTKEDRSALMSRVKSSGTSLELNVRNVVWKAGFRYRLNVRNLPGSPDLVFARYNTVAFVQGCFWHGHTCRKGTNRPISNRGFWDRKLDGNLVRDKANHAKLCELGWKVFVIWECLVIEGTDSLLSHLRDLRKSNGNDNNRIFHPPNRLPHDARPESPSDGPLPRSL